MNGLNVSEQSMLESLLDIRLPSEASGGAPADIAIVIGLAAFVALVLLATVRIFSTPVGDKKKDIHSEIAALSQLPEDERRVALLHVLKAHAPDRFNGLKGELYRPGGATIEQVEAEVSNV